MKLFLLFKWALICLFVLLAWVLAFPLLCVFTALDSKASGKYFSDMGARLQYAIESDFRRLRIRQASALDSERRPRILRLLRLAGVLVFVTFVGLIIYGMATDCPGTAGVYVYCGAGV